MPIAEDLNESVKKFFSQLEEELLDGVDSGKDRWRQYRYRLWFRMGYYEQARSMEGWFKGEIGLFLDRLQKAYREGKEKEVKIVAWNCESGEKGRVDYWVDLGEVRITLECKCLFKGKQGTGQNKTGKQSEVGYASDVFSVVGDVKKPQFEDGTQKSLMRYCLLFLYPYPTEAQLNSLKKSLKSQMSDKGVSARWIEPCYSSPNESALYIGKLEIEDVPSARHEGPFA